MDNNEKKLIDEMELTHDSMRENVSNNIYLSLSS